MATISEETQATIDRAEPFVPETNFVLEDAEPGRGPKRGKKSRGGRPKGKKPAIQAAAEPRPAKTVTATVVHDDPPPTLTRGCTWILRNVVVMMETAYGWDKPDDYEEWLTEASQFSARCVQKYFPNWMAEFGDELLLLAMLFIWVTPNVGKKLRERAEQNRGHDRPEGVREDNPAMSVAQSA